MSSNPRWRPYEEKAIGKEAYLCLVEFCGIQDIPNKNLHFEDSLINPNLVMVHHLHLKKLDQEHQQKNKVHLVVLDLQQTDHQPSSTIGSCEKIRKNRLQILNGVDWVHEKNELVQWWMNRATGQKADVD